MPRDIRNTTKQQELFAALGNMDNPTAVMFADLFGRHKDAPEKYHVDDIISIGPEQSPFVNPDSATTIGIYMINKFIIEPLQIFGYLNVEFDGKIWNKVEDQIAAAMIAGDITTDQVREFIDRTQYLLGGPLAHLINPSITPNITRLPPSAEAMKKKLVKENEEGLKNNDPEISSRVEREVTKEAMRVLHDTGDPSMSIFDSGAVDPDNNYKTMFVMKGAVKDNTGESPTGYKIVLSEYNNGLDKDDIPAIADTVVTSSYSSGVATQDAGYLGKKYNVIYQRIKLGEKGSDCGSTETLNVICTNRHLYRYIIDGKEIKQLTSENIKDYLGKPIKLRSPLHCHMEDPCYCNVCMGDRLYRIGANNVGLTMSTLSGACLNMALKYKHNGVVSLYTLKQGDLEKYIK